MRGNSDQDIEGAWRCSPTPTPRAARQIPTETYVLRRLRTVAYAAKLAAANAPI